MDISQRLIAHIESEIAFEYTYFPASNVVQYKDSFKDTARTVQYARYEYDPSANLIARTIYAYAINQLTNNPQSPSFPKVNANGQMVWTGYVGGNQEIFLYDGSSIIQITDNVYDDFEPQIDANGNIVW